MTMSKMKTPICDFVREYAGSDATRLHMPGHKGVGPLGIEALDITEIDGADVLYKSHGIIRESENNAAALFGSARTVYSTEGSSLSIRAMLYLACLHAKENGKRPHILAGRNAHAVFMYAAAMLDFDVTWLYPEENIFSFASVEQVEKTLADMDEPPTALYITSPDYLGNYASTQYLARICKKYGVLLLVDNAHGAYTRFHLETCHPINLGADMCADSAHKTLPVLTGGAYLHISEGAPTLLSEQAERAMALFASTSPSYLILQSLDAANAYLAGGYAEKLADFTAKLEVLKATVMDNGFSLGDGEPLKITLAPKSYGYTGDELAEILKKSGIVCEFYDADYVVMMFTPEMGEGVLEKVKKALADIPKRTPINECAPVFTRAERAMSIREAMLAPSEVIDVRDACGRVLADAGVSCPPAIPIVICGEVIGDEQIRLFEYYGISTVRVVK